MSALSNAASAGRVIVDQVRSKEIPFMAGSVAYYAFVSLLPLLLLAVLALSVFGDPQLINRVLDALATINEPISNALRPLLTSVSGAVSASVVTLFTVVWGSFKLFRGLDTAFAEIYESPSESSFLDKIRDGVTVLLAIWAAAIVTLTASAVLELFPSLPYLELVNPGVLLVGLSLAFFPIYYVFPDIDQSVYEVLPGVVFAAFGWTALQALFRLYPTGEKAKAYGALGGAVLLVTWLYFSSLVLLLGAVINYVFSGRHDLLANKTTHKTLTRDEAAAYLRSLERELTNPEDDGHADEASAVDLPTPDEPPDSVEVVEHEGREHGDYERIVSLQWPADDAETEER